MHIPVSYVSGFRSLVPVSGDGDSGKAEGTANLWKEHPSEATALNATVGVLAGAALAEKENAGDLLVKEKGLSQEVSKLDSQVRNMREHKGYLHSLPPELSKRLCAGAWAGGVFGLTSFAMAVTGGIGGGPMAAAQAAAQAAKWGGVVFGIVLLFGFEDP
ncbi:MAG: hypothetical protein HYU64_12965 [Armatimonadetes bacterium]|nr:hypothetical protein [Armatimonadota bacterium]